MRIGVIYSCFLLLACGSEPKEKTDSATTKETTPAPVTKIVSSDTDSNLALDDEVKPAPAVQITQKPSGIYRFFLPYEGGQKIRHTIAFYPGTYRLQEEYGEKKDSIVITEGTWAPSSGYIWLYKDQIVRGRYTWKGETLQYYSPQLKKTFSMTKLSPAVSNRVWQVKKKEGVYLYGVGTEPFWSVEVTGTDSLVLNMPDWNIPLRAKLETTSLARDSTVYSTANDSLQVTVYSQFCNDGMSDFLYTKKVKVFYKGETYSGCGEVLQQSR